MFYGPAAEQGGHPAPALLTPAKSLVQLVALGVYALACLDSPLQIIRCRIWGLLRLLAVLSSYTFVVGRQSWCVLFRDVAAYRAQRQHCLDCSWATGQHD